MYTTRGLNCRRHKRKIFVGTGIVLGVLKLILLLYFLGMSIKKPDNFKVVVSQNRSELRNESVKSNVLMETVELNKVVARRFPFLNDPVCRNVSISLYEEDTFNITGLVSYPGSGNTWTRHLIHLASGVFTGSFYFDIELLAGGFLGEKEAWYSGSTIVQKFHEKYSSRLNVNKAILLIREPFKAIQSFANYLEAGHTGTAYRLPYNHRDWPSFLLQSAYNWLSLAKSWIESPSELLVVHYELLRLKPVENLRKMCAFLNHNCPQLSTECFQRKLEGSFRRSGNRVIGEQRIQPKLPIEIRDIISRGIDYLNDLLLKHKHEPMPLNLYQYYSPINQN